MIPPGLTRSLRPAIVPLFCAALVVYFGYHAIHGQRGILARTEIVTALEQAETELARLRAERSELERRAALLDPEHVDLDMLDEQVRRMLNFAAADEVVLMLPGGGRP